jgi:hypothetical protein
MPWRVLVVAAVLPGHQHLNVGTYTHRIFTVVFLTAASFVGMTFSRSAVADNTGGCGRRPLIVCRFSHLLLRKYCVLLRKLVEMAGNFGLDRVHAAFRTSNVVLSLWRGDFLADSVCPPIFRAVSSTSTSSLGIQHP